MIPRIRSFGLARHTIGIALVATTVFLWTASNFLISNILADDSYSKPYLITYINTAFFSLFLLVAGLKHLVRQFLQARKSADSVSRSGTAESSEEASAALLDSDGSEDGVLVVDELNDARMSSSQVFTNILGQLTLRETFWLAFEFCLLWFFANFTLSVALEYTTVASSTVLTATSGMFTLLFGVMAKIERFTILKLCGVVISMTGITMISLVDVSAGDKHRGTFPHKSPAKIALGDLLSLSSAILYGFYSVLMKKRIASEDRVDMLLFLGLVGLINTIILWPGIIFLHLVGLEPFELPTDQRVYSVIILNSIVSILADLSWAYAVVLTSPLVVAVGLSMSIPLAMIGQAVIHSSSAPLVYWIGAVLVFFAFGLINHESKPSNENLSNSRVRLADP